MLKEILYTGVGVASIFKEKVEEEVKKLEESGKIKTDDAKSLLQSIEKKGKEEEEKSKEKLKEMLKDIIKELDIATKQDIEKLKEELKG
ncbi:MAG: hypothetical protein U9Q30_09740 [Campylobacterota bacterium]|nr:hypothetical protein [Campylobacterota bacterium]